MVVYKPTMSHQKHIGNGGVILGIMLISGLIFGLMYLSIYIFPLFDDAFSYAFIAFTVTLLGLLGPYLILKLVFHEAHLRDGHEKEFEIRDIPKDKKQMEDENRFSDY